jgi:elongation factor G
MNGPLPRALRDIGILAHIDAGKTSLTERLLYVSGGIRKAGSIDKGTTATDYLEVERERGITIKAAAAHLEWDRHGATRINLIDTPGHVDFSSEVGRSLRALDGAVVLVCAVAGVQSRTEVLYKACARRGISRLAFVNKLDRRGASFERALGDLRRLLDPGAVAIQLPWGEGELFRGIVDLVEMKAYDLAGPDSGGPAAALPLPESLAEAARKARSALVEAIAGDGADMGDAGLMEDFALGRESSPERVREALRRAAIAGRLTPVLCGSAFVDKSAAFLLDAVVDYLPSPAEGPRPGAKVLAPAARGSEAEEVVSGPGDPFSALVFKTAVEPSLGRLSWARVRSGSVSQGDRVLDAGLGVLVRITRIFGIQAQSLEAVGSAEDGDIVALALAGGGQGEGAASAGSTGTTLCDPKRPILYESIGFAESVVSVALEPRTREDGARLRSGAAALADEDPSLRLGEDPQTGRIELSGMGELQLEVAVERLKREHGVRVKAGSPRVAYRERLSGSASALEDFDRDLGGERARASVALRVGPGRDQALAVETVPELRVSRAAIDAARAGVTSALSVGPSSGFPLEGALVSIERIVLPGGSVSNPGKTALRALEIAAALAAGKALREAGSRIVEPVMLLEIAVPEAYLGAAASAVTGRGGRVESIDSGPEGRRLLSGAAPLRSLFGFAGELRSATEGRAEYSAHFLKYETLSSPSPLISS